MTEQYDVLSEEDMRRLDQNAAIEMAWRAREMHRWALALRDAQQITGRQLTLTEAHKIRETMRIIGDIQALDTERGG